MNTTLPDGDAVALGIRDGVLFVRIEVTFLRRRSCGPEVQWNGTSGSYPAGVEAVISYPDSYQRPSFIGDRRQCYAFVCEEITVLETNQVHAKPDKA